ncbi:serine/threonine dehydratase [Alteromonas sp. 5E99-2]|uniref:serine/threonine dehydratase n=1 Tax=Alteromonas sp. 5E99-2 TaxID=2817683 RepID=UPI001A98EB0E|nr:serine/threonine dehydratase [Alteromonas sp. 5E99-2]MBO1254526.1 serine/threonine dehydratase [Alteromonas sp. 5E99-2]
MITLSDIYDAADRIAPHIQKTPIYSSSILNALLKQNIYFKCECLQKTGAFKIRGAASYIVKAKANNPSLKHIVANSSGNHAQAVAYIANKLQLTSTIYANNTISPIKAAATQSYGATLKTFNSRPEADAAVEAASKQPDTLWVPPFNHPDVIAGQGTVALDAINELGTDIDAVFAPCGGGGLLSGTQVVTHGLIPNAKVIGAEPHNANDALRSLQSGEIVSLTSTPNTLADGAATPAIGEHTFPHLKKLDGFVDVTETRIAYWTQWLQHLLKIHVEPTSAMSMEAVFQWAKSAPKNSRALVLLSGGNISHTTMANIWQQDHLSELPSL